MRRRRLRPLHLDPRECRQVYALHVHVRSSPHGYDRARDDLRQPRADRSRKFAIPIALVLTRSTRDAAAAAAEIRNISSHADVPSTRLLPSHHQAGYTQTINDWYDREIDAINEPNRPIPSGAISEFDVQVQMYTLLFGGWAAAWTLDQWCEHDWPVVTVLVLFGSYISYIYSAPPLKLKQEGWRGNYALGASYIALPWWAGQAVFGELSLDVMVMTVLYSIAGLGIAIVNDFKSIEGDRQMGLMSLPVAFGVEKAKWICVGSIDATQLAVAGYLRLIGEVGYSNVLLALIFPQIFFQFKFFLPDPIKNDVKYQASAQPFLVFGLLTTGLAWGHHINSLSM